MSLTPLEIKKQEFSTTMRGWNVEEVRTFLNLVANEWEGLCDENRDLLEEVKELREKVDHYQQLEESLHETLKDVRAAAQTRMEGARRQADHTVEKAHLQAAAIINHAEHQRGQIYGQIMGLRGRRAEIISSIRAYLQATLESLEQFEDNPAGGHHTPKPLPAGVNSPTSQQIDALVDDLE
jgi:cell division initiation protein